MAKATSAEDYKLISSFEEVRKTLMDTRFSDRLEKPLAFWALPNDRRLPLAFLGRTLRDLLDTPFAELSSTPGIGQKKISSLVRLLHRAINEEPPTVSFDIEGLTGQSKKTAETEADAGGESHAFNPAIVSEALWVKWQETVRRNGIGYERLGRLAPTLQSLPTVIWHTPLVDYLNYTVGEIRQFKTHGEKRVRVVLEVFFVVNEMLTSAGQSEHLAVRLTPKFIAPIEHWGNELVRAQNLPSLDSIQDNLVIPLLDQIKIDVGDTVFKLAESRLGIGAAPQSVRVQSRRMGVTRARVYQLLDECSKVMDVRWPEGRQRFAEWEEAFKTQGATDADLKLFHTTRELFFPEKYEEFSARIDSDEQLDSVLEASV